MKTASGLRGASLHGLVFVSGLCALVYQVAWFRLFRSIFGASTLASAAVLAVFMGGLGLGGLLLGSRVDRGSNPIGFYARLELAIALLAGASPLLVIVADGAYRAAGGSQGLGEPLATVVRLLLSALVIGLPTFLMGGTLPAVARAITTVEDRGRRGIASLYGVNTLGAVAGVTITTFVWLEALGTRRSLWLAALINLLVAIGARLLARRDEAARDSVGESSGDDVAAAAEGSPVRGFLPAAAAIVGFAFFAMELVWYRMFSPVLGGTTYTFGIILIVALAGIGVGGWSYSRGRAIRRPTIGGFGLTCALEALALGIPLALGDRLAFVAQGLRGWGIFGFDGLVAGWTLFAAILILPAAVVAGYQFPLLVGLAGSGRDGVGRQVGRVYAWNTVGAILGSLAGGFGLLPLLSAPGTWRAVIVLLAALGLSTFLWSFRAGWSRPLATTALVAAALSCVAALGPTAYWRHSQIGAGRGEESESANEFLETWNEENRALVWEEDGLESGIGLVAAHGYSFMVNGKSDGNCITDGATQVMGPLVGSMLHPAPRRGLVIGLGTGSSAGWLADVPGMERVDVVELEPVVLRVAETCRAVNRDVLSNPRVEVILGDGREVLLTTDARYDVIFSEPSNPYRAGVSSLFTSEFYRAAADRLAPDGIFVQWLQAYEIDGRVLRTVYATMGDVFPHVETWASQRADLLLVAAKEPIRHDVVRVGERAAASPYREALARVWGVEGAAGFYSGYVAGAELSRELGSGDRERNTDDRPVIEYGFARSLGESVWVHAARLAELDRERGRGYPDGVLEPLGGEEAILEQVGARVLHGGLLVPEEWYVGDGKLRLDARRAYEEGERGEGARIWLQQNAAPAGPADRLLLADGLAEIDHPQAAALRGPLLEDQPVAEGVVSAEHHRAHGRIAESYAALLRALEATERDPFVRDEIAARALVLAQNLGRLKPEWADELYRVLSEPLPAGMVEDGRKDTLFRLSVVRGMEGCREALAWIEPHPFWNELFLRQRLSCYQGTDDPRAGKARRDLDRFLAGTNPPLALPASEENPGE